MIPCEQHVLVLFMFIVLCPQCWREPPPSRGEAWMWGVEGNQGKNNMVTSPLWVSASLDRLINMCIKFKCVFDGVCSTVQDVGTCCTSAVRPQLLFPPSSPPKRNPYAQSKYQECQARSYSLFSPERASPAHLHPPRGEDTHLLLDCARPSGPQHALCGHCSP